MNNEVDDILYFEDHAVFSLNVAQMLFPALIMLSIKWDSYFVYFVWYSYKIIPCFGLAVSRLSYIFIVICVVNNLLSEQSRFKAICFELYVTVDSEGH